MKKILALLITCTMMFGFVPSASAASSRFTDVPDNFWAKDYIEALAAGGLVGGYGGNVFGPLDRLNIDQLATIICNAKGYRPAEEAPQQSYWAYYSVKYCRDELRCLPNFGEITSENYSVACTRELAVHMMTKSLGSNGTTQPHGSLKATDIPDYGDISPAYRATVLEAYRLGLVAGVDANRTFLPKNTLSRAEMCTILYSAGFTTKPEMPDRTQKATGMTGEEIYQELKSWGGWTEYIGSNYKTIYSNAPKTGHIVFKVLDNGRCTLTINERNSAAEIVNEKWVDDEGNVLTAEQLKNGGCDLTTGKLLKSSAWKYEGRQFVKKILELAYPNSTEEAYGAMLSVMRQEVHEIPSEYLPSAIRWIDGRSMIITCNEDAHAMLIKIGVPEDESAYNFAMKQPATNVKTDYRPAVGGSRDVIKLYELDRG